MIEIWGFALFAYVASATPGPNNVLLTAVGASVGIRRGLPALAGIAGGFAMMIFVISIGVGQTIVLADSGFQLGMRLVGLAVLVWLAWKIATAPVTPEGAMPADEESIPKREVGFLRRGAVPVGQSQGVDHLRLGDRGLSQRRTGRLAAGGDAGHHLHRRRDPRLPALARHRHAGGPLSQGRPARAPSTT